jgi:hypothetical protein
MALSPVLIHFFLGGAMLAPSAPAHRIQNLLRVMRAKEAVSRQMAGK